MVRIVGISDTHNGLGKMKVPDGDILIHAGDAGEFGTLEEVVRFSKEMAALPHEIKLFLPGNHDLPFWHELDLALVQLDPSIIYIANRLVQVKGLKIYGMPLVTGMGASKYSAFTYPPRSVEIAEACNAIPDGLDVLVTHGPPQGMRDLHPADGHVGCSTLRRRVEYARPRMHLFGHVHAGYGGEFDEGSADLSPIRYANVASCDTDYEPKNPPVVIDLD